MRQSVKTHHVRCLLSALGGLRAEVERRLQGGPGTAGATGETGPEDQRQLAQAVALASLDRACLRVGYPEYGREAGGRGAGSLLRSHCTVSGDRLQLRFFGKGGKAWDVSLCDTALAAAVARLPPGPHGELMAWAEPAPGEPAPGEPATGERGAPAGAATHALGAAEINRTLATLAAGSVRQGRRTTLAAGSVRQGRRTAPAAGSVRRGRHTAPAVSAKDFRTLRASAVALEMLDPHHGPADKATAQPSRTAARRRLMEAARKAAALLNNTPAIARASYILPEVQAAFACPPAQAAALFHGPCRHGLTRAETALMRLLEGSTAPSAARRRSTAGRAG